MYPLIFTSLLCATNWKKRICPKCQHYWPSQASMKRHMKCHKRSATTSAASKKEEQEEKEDQLEISAMEERMPVVDNIFGGFVSPFSEDIAQL